MEGPEREEPQCPQSAENEPVQTERSSSPSHVSLKSDDSMIQPIHFHSGKRVRKRSPSPDHVSLRSDDSMIQPLHFSEGELQKDPRSSSPSHVSLKSADSMIQPIHFPSGKRLKTASTPDHLSVKSEDSMVQPLHFSEEKQQAHTSELLSEEPHESLCQKHHRGLVMFCKTEQRRICKDCAVKEHREHEKQYIKISTVPNTLMTLQNILANMTASEFREFKRNLSYEYPECFETLQADCSTQVVGERMMGCFKSDDVLNVTVQLASVKPVSRCQEKIKEKLRRRLRQIHEGLALPKTQAVLHDIYTELYITEGGSDTITKEHEVRIIERAAKNCNKQESPVNVTDIFKTSSGCIRTVLTKGVAGIGKTVCVQKFMLDWAEHTANQDIDLILPLFFRDLNLEKEACSLMALLQRYFPELKHIESVENGIKILLVLDGFDECRIHLDFQHTRRCCDIMEPMSMDVLLTNLINGNLLPSSLLWITSRPGTTSQIPSECVQRVTEVRGFNDPQKEEYFHKKCKDVQIANKIIKHVKSSRSMHIMCHIPIFCWLTATVLEILIRDMEVGEIPINQTQLYIHYLFIQTGLKNRKFQSAIKEDLRKLTDFDKRMILSLAKLAFQGLHKNTLIFYECDLKECQIDINDASDFSSLCTQLFREEYGLYRERVFCFLHLSVQEHLAALYVLSQYLDQGINVLASHGSDSTTQKVTLTDIYKCVVVKSLENESGHFDQFLRFLLGLSTESSRKLLNGLLPQLGKESFEIDEVVQFIRDKIWEEDRTGTQTINLFHCLNEMGQDHLVKSLDSDILYKKDLNPEECSALAFIFLMSEDVRTEFHLSKCKTIQASSRQRLLPIIRESRKAILGGLPENSELSVKEWKIVASEICTPNSPVRELDLSHSNIKDEGLILLCKGLKSPHCRLEKLRLEACNITDKSFGSLASALASPKSNLQELDLSLNKLTDKEVKILEPWLKSERCKVQKLSLKQCHLTKRYCKQLAEELSSSSTKKMDLDLMGNDLED